MSQRSKAVERRVRLGTDQPTDRSAGCSTDRSVRTDRRPSSPGTADRRPPEIRHRSLSADAAENLRRAKLEKKRVTLEAGILAAELSAAEAWIPAARQDRQALLAELRELRVVMHADADAARAELQAAVAWAEQENADELAHYRSTNAALRGRLAELHSHAAEQAEQAQASVQAWGREAEAEEAERELRLARTRQESFDKQQTAALRRMTNQAATLKRERTVAQQEREAAKVTMAVAERRTREAEALSRRQAEAIGAQQKQLESLRPKVGELGLLREQHEAQLEEVRNKAQLLELKLAMYIDAHGLLPLVPEPEAPRPKRTSVYAAPRAAPATPAAPARPAATVVGEDGRAVVAEWRAVVGEDGTLQAQLQTLNEEHARQQAAQEAQLETLQRITAERDSHAATSREQLCTIKGLRAEVRQRERDLQNRDQREREPEPITPLQQQAVVKAQAEVRTQLHERNRLQCEAQELRARLDLMQSRCHAAEQGMRAAGCELQATQVALGATVQAVQAKGAEYQQLHASLQQATLAGADARADAAAAAAALTVLGGEVAMLERYVYGAAPPSPITSARARGRSTGSPKRLHQSQIGGGGPLPGRHDQRSPASRHSSRTADGGGEGGSGTLSATMGMGVQQELQWSRDQLVARGRAHQDTLQARRCPTAPLAAVERERRLPSYASRL